MRQTTVAFIVFLLSQTWVWGGVRHIRVPLDGISPDVAVDEKGEVFATFARDEDAFFAVSKDGGRTFSPPVRVNQLPHSVMGYHERGPRIALGAGGTIHIIWMSPQSDRLYYTQRAPGEKTFVPPRNLLDAKTHLDGATLAADRGGNVLVAWLDARLPEDAKNPLSLPIFLTASHDNGRTFSGNEPASGGRLLRACSCCTLKLMAGTGGEFFLGFRGAAHNIRDIFVARLRPSTATPVLSVDKVHDDEWEFKACPMSGPFLSSGPARHRVLVSWMSRGNVYAAGSRDQGRDFAPPRSPQNSKAGSENHPLVLENPQGELFLAWEEGQEIRWQVFDRSGKLLDSGDAGALPEKSKATGFVDASGNFCLVF